MSVSLVIRPSDRVPERPWVLQLRYHGLGGTSYQTLLRLTNGAAHEVVDAGAPHWLYEEPERVTEASPMRLAQMPEGWHLSQMRHEHTPIKFRGDQHQPMGNPDGDWVVELQRRQGGLLTSGRGHTMEDAWLAAVQCVRALDTEDAGS